MQHLRTFNGLQIKFLSIKLQKYKSMPLFLSPVLDTPRLVFRLQLILHQHLVFIGTYEKLQKVAISFTKSLCPSIHMEQPVAPTGWIFMKFDIYFLKICQENSSFIQI